MDDIQILVIHSRGVYTNEYKFGAIAVFHCSVIMHYFQKSVSDLDTFLQLCTIAVNEGN